MSDLPDKILELVAEVYEHFFDQSLNRFLTANEQRILSKAQKIAFELEVEGKLANSGMFSGVLTNKDRDKN